jgi:hypothetical protein
LQVTPVKAHLSQAEQDRWRPGKGAGQQFKTSLSRHVSRGRTTKQSSRLWAARKSRHLNNLRQLKVDGTLVTSVRTRVVRAVAGSGAGGWIANSNTAARWRPGGQYRKGETQTCSSRFVR